MVPPLSSKFLLFPDLLTPTKFSTTPSRTWSGAARAFFIYHGHTVIYHECPGTAAFQALYPTAVIAYLSSLPEGLIAKGHNLLPTRRLAINLAPMLVTPP